MDVAEQWIIDVLYSGYCIAFYHLSVTGFEGVPILPLGAPENSCTSRSGQSAGKSVV